MSPAKRKKKLRKISIKRPKFAYKIKTSLIIAILEVIIKSPILLFRWYFGLIKNKGFLKFLIFNFALLTLVGAYLLGCFLTLPDIDKITDYRPILSTRFYDRNGEMIFETSNEKRMYVNIKDVPEKLIYAFISAEDRTFYTNSGIDVSGMVRAGISDIWKILRRQKLAGASTITQQVVKNVLLTHEQKITRKIKELILAKRLTKILSKDKIMEIYLNHIYLGMQAYGIVVAADEYFGKTLAQLTIPEMAMLAALPKAPSSINPFRSYNRAVQRRNYVLSRMYEDGYITKDEYEEYINTELIVHRKVNKFAPFYAPSFFAQALMSSKEIGITKDQILNEGYNVQLTIDGRLQHMAQDALNENLERYAKNHGFTGAIFSYNEEQVNSKTPAELLRGIDEPENLGNRTLAVVLEVNDKEVKIGLKDNETGTITLNDLSWARQKLTETSVSQKSIMKCQDVLKVGDVIIVREKTNNSNYYTLEQIPTINGSVLIMQPKTGEILAMIGGYLDQAGAFNRSVQAFRQVGSTIKPIVYSTALENDFTPASIFMDADISMNIGDGLTWDPSNHNGTTNGPITLRSGLERSKNTVTVRIADAVGMKKIKKAIIDFGINDKPEDNLSVALGSVESSTIKMATAFSAFANNGQLPNTFLIKSITPLNRDNKNVFDRVYFSKCDINLKCNISLAPINNKQVFDLNNEGDYDENGELIKTNHRTKNAMENDEDLHTNQNYSSPNEAIGLLDRNGNALPKMTPITPETAYQMANILQGAVKRGTSSGLSALGIPLASKTGTSNGGRDMWNIAITPELVIAVYIGYDQPMDTNNYGSQYALPVVREILSKLTNKIHFTDFSSPSGIKFVKINRITGKATSEALGANVIFEAFKENDEIDNIQGVNISEEENSNIDITDIGDLQ